MQFLTAVLFAASVAAAAAAKGTAPLYFINYFGDAPGLLEVGKSYTAEWTATKEYDAELMLVQKTAGGGWEPVKTIFSDKTYKTGNFSYEFSVPNVEDGKWFGLWLSGEDPESPSGSKTGYADLSPWFGITGGTLVDGAGLTKAAIAGIIVGVLAVLSIVAAAAWFLITRRRRVARKATVVLPVAEPAMEERRSMDSIDEAKERAELAAKRDLKA